MRVLVVHNFYGSGAPSGENSVVLAEHELLARAGHAVERFERHSDAVRGRGALGALQAAAVVPWNPAIGPAIRGAIDAFRPDVVHVHNTFPLISPAVFRAIGDRAARVLTVHNFRLVCPAAIPMREGRICTECMDRRSVLPSLRHGCYRDSRVATAPLAASVALHRALGTWHREVEAFVALTAFQRDRLVDAGLPADRMHVKGNFVAGDPVPRPWAERDDAVAFAGRISAEKGIDLLVDAWLRWGPDAPELRIVGDGPLREPLQARAASRPDVRIRFLGRRSREETADALARARLVVMPSVWYETFGMVLCEAFSVGTPVAVSDLGSLPSIAKPGVAGVAFAPGDAGALLDAVRAAWASGELERLGRGARAEFERHHTERANLERLLEVYRAAIAARDARVAGRDARAAAGATPRA